MDLAANEKDVHADFFNGIQLFCAFVWQKKNSIIIIFSKYETDFEDLCDEDEETASSI